MTRTKLTAVIAMLVASTMTGCVSKAKYDQSQDRARKLAYKLDVAEKTLAQRKADLELQRQAVANAKKESAVLRQQLNSKDNDFDQYRKDMKSQLTAQLREKVRAELDAEYTARMADLKQSMPTVEVSAYGGLVLESEIFFKPGQHKLLDGGKAVLKPLIDKFNSPEFANYSIEIAGHTDSDPIKHTKHRYSDNHILAANRANEVRKYLISQGVSPSRTYITAWGAQRPLTPSSPKSKNRRVEIVLHREDAKFVNASAPK